MSRPKTRHMTSIAFSLHDLIPTNCRIFNFHSFTLMTTTYVPISELMLDYLLSTIYINRFICWTRVRFPPTCGGFSFVGS